MQHDQSSEDNVVKLRDEYGELHARGYGRVCEEVTKWPAVVLEMGKGRMKATVWGDVVASG